TPEPPRLSREVREPVRPEEAGLEPPAIAVGEARRHAIALRALRAQPALQAVAPKQQMPEAGGEGAFVLQAQEEGGGQVLVHLRLQLELELRRGARGAG